MNVWMFFWTIFLIAIILIYIIVAARITWGGAKEIGTMLRRLDAEHHKQKSSNKKIS